MKSEKINFNLIKSLAKNDFKAKFAGSYLGVAWAFIQPVVTVLVYWFVFEKGMKSSALNLHEGIKVPYVLWLVAGIVPWFFFQEALMSGTNTLIEYSYLVKKVVFQIEVLPLVKIISAFFVHVFFILITLLIFCFYGMLPDLYTLQIFYYGLATVCFTVGLIYITSAVVVFFRDLSQAVGIALQVGMWMTPIMWNVDTIELSPVLIGILKLNPLYYIVTGYRDALIYKQWFWQNLGMTVYFWAVVLVFWGLGKLIFGRLRPHFADVL